MVTASHPPARRLIIGRALRQFREGLGLDLEDAARVLDCDRSKISRIETGERGIRARELRELLAEYGIDEDTREALARVADPRAASGWWKTYAGILPDTLVACLALHSAASEITIYEAQRVPAVLQTPQYAHALAAADPLLADGEARDAAVRATLRLQRAVLGESKPEVRVILGEAALHQAAGEPAEMEGQIGLLNGVSGDSGQVTVQVLPFAAGAHAAPWGGSLTLLGFGGTPRFEVAHAGGPLGGVLLDEDKDVKATERVLARLKSLALPPAKTAVVLRGLRLA